MSSEKLARLREKQKTIAAQIQREENRLKKEERKKDTRRKILVGAAVLHKASKDSEYNKWLIHNLLDGFLDRTDDRALFGLSPKQGAEQKTEKPAEQ